MTKVVLPKFLEKKGGVIVNLSSAAAELNPPMFSVYNATKVTFSTELVQFHVISALPSPRNALDFFVLLCAEFCDLIQPWTLQRIFQQEHYCPGGFLLEQS